MFFLVRTVESLWNFKQHVSFSALSLSILTVLITHCVRHENADLTSDQGVVYHLKHGLSKQVFSSSGLFSLPPHASSSYISIFPPLIPTHRTTLLFTPRPQVVLHCRKRILFRICWFFFRKLNELNASSCACLIMRPVTLSHSWLSQCGAQSLSPQGWMASGLFSAEHWFSGTTRPSGVLQYT